MKTLVPEDYSRLVRLSSLALAPDGTMAYVKYYWADNAWQRRVEIARDGKAREITLGGAVENCPAFSRDGKLLWFLSDGRAAVYDRETEEVRQAFSLPGGFAAVDLLPLDQGCAFACRKEIREDPPPGCDWRMPLIAEELRFRDDSDHGFKKQYLHWLCVYGGNGARPRILAEGSKPFRALALLPDEKSVLCFQDGFQLIDLADGNQTNLSASFSPVGDIRPVVSRDGRYALIAAACGEETCLRRLWLDQKEHAADEYENEPAGLSVQIYMDLSPERKTLVGPGTEKDTYYVSAMEAHIPGLWRVQALESRLVYTRIPAPGLIVETAGESAQEKGVAILEGSSVSSPRPAFLRDSAIVFSAPDSNPWLSGACIAPCRPVAALSQDGRAELTGYVLLPESPKEKIPLLVWVHGGPSGCWSVGFNLEVQCAVSRGFGVLLPNPRGSTGRLNAYADPAHAFDGGAANDILCLMDETLRQYPRLNPKCVSVLGGSYGGFMAAWMAGNTARFRCAVVVKAVTNWLFIHFNSSQAGQPIFEEYRDFQDFLVDTVKASPVFAAGDVNIPTLIIHGEKDQQVPVENAHQFYTALKDCHPDLPVRLMLLPDCCHAYARDALPDYIAIQRETLRWLNAYGKEKDE